jgi:hypothetical protein
MRAVRLVMPKRKAKNPPTTQQAEAISKLISSEVNNQMNRTRLAPHYKPYDYSVIAALILEKLWRDGVWIPPGPALGLKAGSW